MNDQNGVAEYAEWLADLANEDLTGEDLRNTLAARIQSAEIIERAAREVEIARRVRLLMLNLRQAEIVVPADFEAKLMARIGEDETLLNLLEFYLAGFGQTLVALLNVLFSFFPESPTPESAAV